MATAEIIYEELKNAPPGMVRQVLGFVEFLEARRSQETRTFGDFFGALKDSSAFKGDPVEIQRKICDEWA